MKDHFRNIKKIDPLEITEEKHPNQYVGCIILTHDKKILLQHRGINWKNFPGYLAEFGGRIEKDEKPSQALVRELKEELGAKVILANVISFGPIIEKNHDELIYCYFWSDLGGSIKNCFEGEAKYFYDVNSILKQEKFQLTEGLRWLLNECKLSGLLK